MLKYAADPALELEQEMLAYFHGGVFDWKFRYALGERPDGSPDWSIVMVREVSNLHIPTQHPADSAV